MSYLRRPIIAALIVVGAAILLGCDNASPPTASPTVVAPAATTRTSPAGTASPSTTPASTPTQSATLPPAPPSATQTAFLQMSNRPGDIKFAKCTISVPIDWYQTNTSELLSGAAEIEITGPDIAGISNATPNGTEVTLTVDFPLAKEPRTWKVTLLKVGDRPVAPSPRDAKGSQYTFTGPAGNCP